MRLKFNQAIAEPSKVCILYTTNSKHNLVRMANKVKPLFTGNDTLTLLLMALEHMSTFVLDTMFAPRKTPQLGLVAGVSILQCFYCMCLPYSQASHTALACERGSVFTNLTKTKRL